VQTGLIARQGSFDGTADRFGAIAGVAAPDDRTGDQVLDIPLGGATPASSKSLRSKTSERCGIHAEFDTCASPQHMISIPLDGLAAMTAAEPR
jgi:hypothetical protein